MSEPTDNLTAADTAADTARIGQLADPVALGAWMDAQELPGEGEPEVTYISGGASNEIFGVARGELSAVLRRPPENVPPGRNETILREYRILEALNRTDVPHPTALAACSDESVIGSAFYLMSYVEGWSCMATPGEWPEPFHSDLSLRPGLAYTLVDGAARMAQVDYTAVGLGDLGRPDGFHERQVDRWLKQWSSYKVRELPGIDEAVAFLRSYRPRSFTPGIMHGDYQFANVMYGHEAPARLAAIVDFEMSTIGDPLLDLAWILMPWPNADEDRSQGYVDYEGMPDREDLLEHYTRATGRPVDEIDYYLVLGNMKMAIVLEGGYSRMLSGSSDNPKARHFGDYVLQSARRAGEIARSTRLGRGS